MESWKYVAVIGMAATALIDLWSIVRKQLFATPMPNYSLVGRWLGHMPSGRFHHHSIAAAPVVPGERLIGWTAHYLIGMAFAAMLLGLWGVEWVLRPTLMPALVTGVGTVVMPFLVMQPGMGAGIAASRTPRPRAARLQSLVTHALFGLGLYAGGWIAHLLFTT
jgi:hypothetical protein